MSVQLNYKELGSQGPLVIILHGLYGSSDNWMAIARMLASDFRILLVDQRNHGASPHTPEHSYLAMADDLLALMDQLNIESAHIAGHSMGGKTAMAFALLHPDRVDRLVVLDIAPKSYASFSNYGISTNNHAFIMDAMLDAPLALCQSRQEIDGCLAEKLTDKGIRQFLLKNVTRNDKQQFAWKLNLPVLRENLDEILDGFTHTPMQKLTFTKPSVFIRGEKSGYVMDDDVLGIRRLFPKAELVTIPDAGHWLHAEQPELVQKTIHYFLEE